MRKNVFTLQDSTHQGLHMTENGISYVSERNRSVTARSISYPCEACALDKPGYTT